MDFQDLSQYEVIRQEEVTEADSSGYLLIHKKSGAGIFILSNPDTNRVFNIAFRTPPADSTGVAHIIEHTVLCGSEKYPAKDPFVELCKGSLNTFLNAMTYPDKTMYPVASTNEKDFENLMSVYLDAVFYPNITKNKNIFLQEGWHFETDKTEGEEKLTINGVVYNEMKGAFSSADDVLSRSVQSSLYPDTPYAYVSGGDPDCIPELTYENYLAFYRKYYHPSNSYIYLYGDLDVKKILNWMDREYLSHFDRVDPQSEIALQKPFDKLVFETIPYSVTEAEAEEAGCYYSWNKVIGTILDPVLYLAFQILDYVLLGAPGAPFEKALLDSGFGIDIYGGYDEGLQQPSFNITVKDAPEGQCDRFLEVIDETLEKLVKEGLNKRSLLAGLNSLEFRAREKDYGRLPKGLVIGMMAMDSWLYKKEDPFLHLEYEKNLQFLREQIDTDYYEKLIETYLIRNQHGSVITAVPEIGMTERLEKEREERLMTFQKGLTKAELDAILKETEEFKLYQDTPTPEEVLEKIPMLNIEDISRVTLPLVNELRTEKGLSILFHPVFTGGIGYFEMIFDADFVSEEELPYLKLLKRLLGSLDTDSHTYNELADDMNIYTGGMGMDVTTYMKQDREAEAEPELKFMVRFKALYQNLREACQLLSEILLETDYSDDKRIREIIGEGRSRMKESLQSSGHSAAIRRASSYLTKAGWINEQLSGIAYYDFLDELYKNYESRKDELKSILSKLAVRLFTKERLLISYTADEEGYEALKQQLSIFSERLSELHVEKKKLPFTPVKKNEGICCASQIQFVCRLGRFDPDKLPWTGSISVLKNILEYVYLWKNIREQGGAYGCMDGFSRSGLGYFVSYLDPHMKRTNEVFEKIPEFIENFTAADRDMTKYIIGVIGDMDVPLTPNTAGSRSMNAYLSNISYEQLQKERLQVLDTTVEEIRRLAPYVRAVLDCNCLCVIGNEGRIQSEPAMFGEIRAL